MEWRDLALLLLVAAAASLQDEGMDGPLLSLEPFLRDTNRPRPVATGSSLSFSFIASTSSVGSSIGEQQPTRIKLKDAFMTYGTIY